MAMDISTEATVDMHTESCQYEDIVIAVIDKYNGEKKSLISMLLDIQRKYNYLPKESIEHLSQKLKIPLIHIYDVATFYKVFSLKPRGKHLISVCLGTACHVRNAPLIANDFENKLGIAAGETTPDKEFTLEHVNCLGACALGPIVVADGHYFSNVDAAKIDKIIENTKVGLDKVEVETDQRVFPVKINCPRCNHSLMDQKYMIDGYPSIRLTISFGNKHGWFRLSSLYGSFAIESEYDIPMDTVMNFFCPHCHAELTGAYNCAECGAPMIPMIVRGGGMVQVCARRGCKSHMLDLNGVNF